MMVFTVSVQNLETYIINYFIMERLFHSIIVDEPGSKVVAAHGPGGHYAYNNKAIHFKKKPLTLTLKCTIPAISKRLTPDTVVLIFSNSGTFYNRFNSRTRSPNIAQHNKSTWCVIAIVCCVLPIIIDSCKACFCTEEDQTLKVSELIWHTGTLKERWMGILYPRYWML